ncbi:MAG: hypothetical protein IJL72_04010 [Lachnospiraceae bacterium]|nr:hypothetical protein [Lachnospiraceae bacterium]
MKYTLEEKIDIGRQLYTREKSRAELKAKYGVCNTSLSNFLRQYKIANGIPERTHIPTPGKPAKRPVSKPDYPALPDIEAYRSMSKEELINELILAKANELRAKKGYEVKGAGANKEFVSLNNRNTKS